MVAPCRSAHDPGSVKRQGAQSAKRVPILGKSLDPSQSRKFWLLFRWAKAVSWSEFLAMIELCGQPGRDYASAVGIDRRWHNNLVSVPNRRPSRLRSRRQRHPPPQTETGRSRRALNRDGRPVRNRSLMSPMAQPHSRRREKGDRVLRLLIHNLSHLRCSEWAGAVSEWYLRRVTTWWPTCARVAIIASFARPSGCARER